MTPHRYRIYIRASQQQVWQGITDPEFTSRYFHGTAFQSSLEPGSQMRYVMAGGDDAVEGVIEVADAPNRLVTTWRFMYDAAMAEEPPSRVEWVLTAAGEGLTRVDVVHSDLARSPITWGHVQHGWVWILDNLKTLLETGDVLPDETLAVADRDKDDVNGQWHRAQAIECNNSVWEMIEAERTPANDEEMLRRAYAAAYHWQRAKGAGPVNEVRAVYMLAKALLLAGQAARSLHYADACLAGCIEHGLVDFDLAYAHEVRARALRAAGREAEGLAEWAAALAVAIADPEDKAILDADFADAPVTV